MHLISNKNPVYFSLYLIIWTSKFEPISHTCEKPLAGSPRDKINEITFRDKSASMIIKDPSILLDSVLNQKVKSSSIFSFSNKFYFLFLLHCHYLFIF